MVEVDGLEHQAAAEPGAHAVGVDLARLRRAVAVPGERPWRSAAIGAGGGGRVGRHWSVVSLDRDRARRTGPSGRPRAVGARRLPLLALGAAEEAGEHEEDQHEAISTKAAWKARSMRTGWAWRMFGPDDQRQGALVVDEAVRVHDLGAEGGEEQRRRLPHDAGDPEEHGGDHPERAVGSTTDQTVRHSGAPRARDASRRPPGTTRSTSSTTLVTEGSRMTKSASEAAKPE